MESNQELYGRIVAVSLSDRKGVKKANVKKARLLKNHGMENDAHAGKWHRQVSLLAIESIKKIRDKGLDFCPRFDRWIYLLLNTSTAKIGAIFNRGVLIS